MSNQEVKDKVGQKVIYLNKEWTIVGDDTNSSPHPSGAFKKWEYLLKDKDGKTFPITTEQIAELTFVQT